jgi:hypothetical protein
MRLQTGLYRRAGKPDLRWGLAFQRLSSPTRLQSDLERPADFGELSRAGKPDLRRNQAFQQLSSLARMQTGLYRRAGKPDLRRIQAFQRLSSLMRLQSELERRAGKPDLRRNLAFQQISSLARLQSDLDRRAGKPDLRWGMPFRSIPFLQRECFARSPSSSEPRGRPRPVVSLRTQPGLDRVILDVLNDAQHLRFITRPVVIRLILPEHASSRILQLIDLAAGVPFDPFQDTRKIPTT